MTSMSEYNIGYLDGRNHVLELTVRFVSSRIWDDTPERKAHATASILQVLSDRNALEHTLCAFDPGFFNNFDEDIGPID